MSARRDTVPTSGPLAVLPAKSGQEALEVLEFLSSSPEDQYFSELLHVPFATDAEKSSPLDDDPLILRHRSVLKRLARHPWTLIVIGILIGAATALTGSLLALMTR